jgi:hypothetical protein
VERYVVLVVRRGFFAHVISELVQIQSFTPLLSGGKSALALMGDNLVSFREVWVVRARRRLTYFVDCDRRCGWRLPIH